MGTSIILMDNAIVPTFSRYWFLFSSHLWYKLQRYLSKSITCWNCDTWSSTTHISMFVWEVAAFVSIFLVLAFHKPGSNLLLYAIYTIIPKGNTTPPIAVCDSIFGRLPQVYWLLIVFSFPRARIQRPPLRHLYHQQTGQLNSIYNNLWQLIWETAAVNWI